MPVKEQGMDAQMKRVLVTGGTGFIGSHLVKRLMDDNYSIRILGRSSNRAQIEKFKENGVEYIQGDIRDFDKLKYVFQNIDVVFHLAGIVSDWDAPDKFRDINTKGTENVCKAALEANVKLLIYTSTNDVFGLREDKVITEEDEFEYWHEPYPDSKIEATRIVREYGKKGLPASIIYPCWVYGPGDTTFITPLSEGIKSIFFCYWRKNALIWPLFIDNLIDLLMLMATNPNAVGNEFIAHDGICISFEDFTAKLSHHLGIKVSRRYTSYICAYSFAYTMESFWKLFNIKSRPLLTSYSVKNLGSRLRFSIKNAKDKLNWRPSCSYEKGMDITMKWFKDHLET